MTFNYQVFKYVKISFRINLKKTRLPCSFACSLIDCHRYLLKSTNTSLIVLPHFIIVYIKLLQLIQLAMLTKTTNTFTVNKESTKKRKTNSHGKSKKKCRAMINNL